MALASSAVDGGKGIGTPCTYQKLASHCFRISSLQYIPENRSNLVFKGYVLYLVFRITVSLRSHWRENPPSIPRRRIQSGVFSKINRRSPLAAQWHHLQ